MNTHKQKGFTLLELMVAISIFAIVSLLTMGGLSNILDTQAHTEKSMQRLIRMQMVFTIMSRELQQLAKRPIRDEYGADMDAITSEISGGFSGIEFTHQGRFSLGDTVSLQRVAYYLEDKKLIKKIWRVLDRVEDTKANKQIIIDGVDDLNISFYSISQSNNKDPAFVRKIEWQSTLTSGTDDIILAIKIAIKPKDSDEIYRVFNVAQ
jgi:general secretion pathway protein J